MAVWGVLIEPRWLEVTHHTVAIPELHDAWKGEKIAFLADFQVGMWLGNESTIEKAVTEILKIQPAAVLIGGDFIYHPTDDDSDEAREEWNKDDRIRTQKLVDQVVEILKPITAKNIPLLAVLGNHDYSMGTASALRVEESAAYLSERLEAIGTRVLKNQSVALQKSDQPLHLVGLGPHYPDLSDPQKALQGAGDGPKIMFMHNANSLEGLSRDRFAFSVAGHTHGGQIRIPGFPHFSWTSLVPHTPDDVMGDGWIVEKGAPSRKIYVNRGIGFSTLPVRLNCRPELTIFHLND